MLYIYLVFITLYFSGVGAAEFRRSIEKKWDKERNRTFTPNQKWLIPQPRSNSWGDSKIFNKVNLVKDIIGYKPRINTKNDERNMRTYLKESPKDKLVIPKAGLNEEYLPMGASLLDFLTVETEGSVG